MTTRVTAVQADAEFQAAGLTPLTAFTRVADEREAICNRCNTWRRVTLRSIRDPASAACRWCHGWLKWSPWAARARQLASTHRPIRGIEFSHAQIQLSRLVPMTGLGDEFTPVGCLCPACGETLVTVPERITADRPGWFGCQRCYTSGNRSAATEAQQIYARAGLRLLSPIRGQWTKYPAECLNCKQLRHVSYRDAVDGTGAACWTCTHGIRPDEPHRVYLFRFPAIGVLKVGITHNRHDRRLIEHRIHGGELLESQVVPDRGTALAVEAWVLATKTAWLRRDAGPEHFPQGGWTEAWSEAHAPAPNLAEVCTLLSQ